MAGIELPIAHVPASTPADAPPPCRGLARRAQRLAWAGIAWHGIEAAVAIIAGLVAGSVALVGFGVDSVIESLAGLIVVWRFAAARLSSEHAERRAQHLIAASFFILAAYVIAEALRALIGGHRPEASWVGIGLSVVTLVTMPALAATKTRLADALGSSATKSEARQNLLCAYLSAALLVGLAANALFGAWWADPATALVIGAVAVREGRDAWRGESCCAAPAAGANACHGGCCSR